MRAENTLSSRQVGSYKGEGTDLLNQLESRVNQTLNLDKAGDNDKLAMGDLPTQKADPVDVKMLMAEIAGKPFAGMNHSILA